MPTMSTIKKLPRLMRAPLPLAIISVTLVNAATNDAIGVRLCGCPQSACPENCNIFSMNECQPMYTCFLEGNGLFGYVRPEFDSDGEVLVRVYTDGTCQTQKFDPASNGFKGSCDSDCWSTVSKIGAQGCIPATEETVKLCGCPESSACPDRCDTFSMNECQPMYKCFLEGNGIFGYVRPEFDSDGEVLVHVYNDRTCQNPRFDPASNGFKGSCTNDCWSETSKIGARGCSSGATTNIVTTKYRIVGTIALAIACFGPHLFL